MSYFILTHLKEIFITIGALIIGLRIYRMIKRSRKQAEKDKAEASLISEELESMGVSNAFKCPSCGASLVFDPNHVSTYCSFCGSALPKAEDLTKLIIEHSENTAQRRHELEKLKIEKEKSNNFNKNKMIMFVAYVIMVIVMFVFFYLMSHH